MYSPIWRYLNDCPKEEVLQQIEREQANTREQIADRQERLYARAREAEFNATKDEPIECLVSESDINELVEDGVCSIRGQSLPRQYIASAGEKIIVGHDPAQSPTGDKAAFVTQPIQDDGRRRL